MNKSFTLFDWHRMFPLGAILVCVSLLIPAPLLAQKKKVSPAKLEAMKKELAYEIDKQQKLTQEMVDMISALENLGFRKRKLPVTSPISWRKMDSQLRGV